MSEDIYDVAAGWHLAQSRDDMDWPAFGAWLAADPRHRAAYDDIALLDDAIDRHGPAIASLLPANDVEPAGPRRSFVAARWAGVAVVLLAIVSVGLWWSRPGREQATTSIVAVTGQSRTVRVADGATAVLAGGSRLVIAPDKPVALSGTAWFDVRHDPSRPLTIAVPGYEIRDVGTRFDVSSDGKALRVAVAEGSVTVTALGSGQRVEVVAGRAVVGDATTGALTLAPVAPASVGAWRNGRFVYDQVPLSLVAADIARYTGRPVSVDPGLARQRFSGVLAPGDRDSMVEALRQLAGISVRKEGDAVRLGAAADN